LNYLDDSGTWQPTATDIEIIPGGGLYRHGQFNVVFSPDISDAVAVQLLTPAPEMLQLKSRVFGLAYFDPASDQNLLFAELKAATGELLPSGNQVLYPDAFTNLAGGTLVADVRFSITKMSFEQEIVLRTQPPTPESLGLSTNANLVIMTEFFDAPLAQEELGPDGVGVPSDAGSSGAHITFGHMSIEQGSAFSLGDTGGSIPVTRTWIIIENRRFLLESVPVSAIRDQLQQLPSATSHAARTVPRVKEYAQRARLPSKPTKGELKIASVMPAKKGFILDYIAVIGSATNVTFAGNTTYYVSGPYNVSGPTVFEGGSVIKHARTNAPSINLSGTNICRTWFYGPLIVTGVDDNTVGAIIPGSTGTPTNYYASNAFNILDTPSDLRNLRISWANTAVQYNTNNSAIQNYLTHVQVVNCKQGIVTLRPQFFVRNALFYNVQTNFLTPDKAATGSCEHVTVDAAWALNGSAGVLALNLTNCLLVNVTNTSGYTGASNSTYSGGATPFGLPVLTGYHYLATDSAERNSGVPNITSQLQSDFASFTTYPPLVFSNTVILANTVWGPQAQRDTDIPDRGYHYPALDYLVTGVQVTNGAILLTNGAAMGVYGGSGIQLWKQSSFISQGTAQALNHLLRYEAVQEVPVFWAGSNLFCNVISAPYDSQKPSPPPSLQLRFSEISLLADLDDRGSRNRAIGDFAMNTTVRDCALYNLNFAPFPTDQTMTNVMINNVFQYPLIFYEDGGDSGPFAFEVDFYNNLLLSGSFSLDRSDANAPWAVRDTLFDSVSTQNTSVYPISVGNNGYRNTTTFGGTSNVTLTVTDYVPGPFGSYYYPTNGSSGGLTNLFHVGSRSAATAGLYHETVRVDQIKETNSIVSIGFHYVATDANGAPFDTNGDGIPDYLQDANDNGLIDSGEIDWTTAGDPGLNVLITEPKRSANVP
jgi:hypothetical protein